MSSEHPDRAIEHLEALIVELGGLRNAGTRDPGFKAWRQNTLTAIQRFWPGDQTRSDRFRRVPFSPPSNKMSAKLTREFFERGCAEAVPLLRSLILEIQQQGLPDSDGAPLAAETDMSADVDFPMVDLPREGETSTEAQDIGAAPRQGPGRTMSNLPPVPEAPRREAPRGRAPEHPIASQPKERRKATRIGSWARKAMAPRLKDMLGFSDEASDAPREQADEAPPAHEPQAPAPPVFEAPAYDQPAYEPPAAEAPAYESLAIEPTESETLKPIPVAPPSAPPKTKPGTIVVRGATPQPSPTPSAPQAAGPPHAAPPHAAPARPVAPPKQPVTPPPVAPTPLRAAPPPPPVTLPPRRVEPTYEEQTPRFDPEFSPPLENLGPEPPFLSDPEPLYEPEPAYEPEPEAEPEPEYEREPEPEPETEPEFEEVVPRTQEERVRQSAADEFLRNSPVLRAEARPLKREERRHMPQPASAVATALTALASEVGTLGVPEGQRAGARAALLDLARQLDDHTLSWSSLRESMQFVMEYPALARRVVPLLIPYLDVAA
jgi:hypothetical protein